MFYSIGQTAMLVFGFSLVVVVIGCAPTSGPKMPKIELAESTQVPLELAQALQSYVSTSAQVGNQVGDIAPEFSMVLTNGETLSYSRNEAIPTFLFFFSPN